MNQSGKSGRYILLNDSGARLANGQLENPVKAGEIRIRIPEEKALEVLKHARLWLKEETEGALPQAGYIVQFKDGVLSLILQQEEGIRLRQSLRVPICFDTLLYAKDEDGTRRYKVESYDLSCGGIAFFCSSPLAVGKRYEIVIPMTLPKPLLLSCELLRKENAQDGRTLYAARFVDMYGSQEAMVCEAVFGIQLSSAKK